MWLTWTISTDSVLHVPHPECHPECQQRNINVYHFNTEQVGSEATFMDAILFRNLILLMLQLAFEHQILTLIVSLSWSLNYWTGNSPLISCISLRELQCISYKWKKKRSQWTLNIQRMTIYPYVIYVYEPTMYKFYTLINVGRKMPRDCKTDCLKFINTKAISPNAPSQNQKHQSNTKYAIPYMPNTKYSLILIHTICILFYPWIE